MSRLSGEYAGYSIPRIRPISSLAPALSYQARHAVPKHHNVVPVCLKTRRIRDRTMTRDHGVEVELLHHRLNSVRPIDDAAATVVIDQRRHARHHVAHVDGSLGREVDDRITVCVSPAKMPGTHFLTTEEYRQFLSEHEACGEYARRCSGTVSLQGCWSERSGSKSPRRRKGISNFHHCDRRDSAC